MEKNYRAELTGVFGDPVEGNPTGVMEEAAYEAMGLNYRYITMKVTPEGFPDAMKAVKKPDLEPKEKISALRDRLNPARK